MIDVDWFKQLHWRKTVANLKAQDGRQNVILRIYNTTAEEVSISENKLVQKSSEAEGEMHICKIKEREGIKEEMVNFDNMMNKEKRKELVSLLIEFRVRILIKWKILVSISRCLCSNRDSPNFLDLREIADAVF